MGQGSVNNYKNICDCLSMNISPLLWQWWETERGGHYPLDHLAVGHREVVVGAAGRLIHSWGEEDIQLFKGTVSRLYRKGKWLFKGTVLKYNIIRMYRSVAAQYFGSKSLSCIVIKSRNCYRRNLWNLLANNSVDSYNSNILRRGVIQRDSPTRSCVN